MKFHTDKNGYLWKVTFPDGSNLRTTGNYWTLYWGKRHPRRIYGPVSGFLTVEEAIAAWQAA